MDILLLYFSLYAHLNVLKVMNKILHFLIHVLIGRVHAPQLAACEKSTDAPSLHKMSCKFKSVRVRLCNF